MRVILRPRQQGKTLELINISEKTGAIIVVPKEQMIDNVLKLAKKHFYEIQRPITVNQAKDLRIRSSERTGLVIDNVNLILNEVVGWGHDIKAIAIDGLQNEVDYDEYSDHESYRKLTYSEYCKLKEKAWKYDQLNK